SGYERSHEEPRDRSIAVGEMEVVALRFLATNRVEVLARARSRIHAHRAEPRIAEAEGILRWHGIDADAEQPVWASLVERQHAGVKLPHLGEEVRIAHAREARLLLGLAEARHRVEALGHQLLVIAPHRVAHGRRSQKRFVTEVAGQQAIGAEGFLVEEERGAE